MTSATQIFDVELLIRLTWAYVARLITCPCLWFLVETSSQNLTRHLIENMRDFFLDLERWPRRLLTMVEAFWQMFMSPSGIVLATILCSFMTCQSRQGSLLRFTLIFWQNYFGLSRFLKFWGSKFLSVKSWSREPRRIISVWDDDYLYWTCAEGDAGVSRAGTRWGDL
jgi:hypothetical protein